jgi:hypothetical protein
MIAAGWVKVTAASSLGVIAVILAGSVAASPWRPRRAPAPAEPAAGPGREAA